MYLSYGTHVGCVVIDHLTDASYFKYIFFFWIGNTSTQLRIQKLNESVNEKCWEDPVGDLQKASLPLSLGHWCQTLVMYGTYLDLP